MDKLRERRQLQLDKEEKIDKLLSIYYKECPTLVFEYMASCREINRKLSRELYRDFSLFKSYDNFLKSLDTTEVMQNIDLNGNICDRLPDMIWRANNIRRNIS